MPISLALFLSLPNDESLSLINQTRLHHDDGSTNHRNMQAYIWYKLGPQREPLVSWGWCGSPFRHPSFIHSMEPKPHIGHGTFFCSVPTIDREIARDPARWGWSTKKKFQSGTHTYTIHLALVVSLLVCGFLIDRERERERETACIQTHTHIYTHQLTWTSVCIYL